MYILLKVKYLNLLAHERCLFKISYYLRFKYLADFYVNPESAQVSNKITKILKVVTVTPIFLCHLLHDLTHDNPKTNYMTLLLISIVITAAATLIQAFWKMETWKPRLIFTSIILLGIAVSYLIAKDDAVKNKELEADMERSQLLLQSANDQLTVQSETINKGFSDLKSQISSQGINNQTIVNTINNLEVNVQRLTVDSKNSISEALGLNDQQGFPGKNRDFYVELGNKNAVVVDTKNQFAVSSDKPDENNKITIVFNGRKWGLAPGEQYYFASDQMRPVYLVYKGLDGNRMVFFIKSH